MDGGREGGWELGNEIRWVEVKRVLALQNAFFVGGVAASYERGVQTRCIEEGVREQRKEREQINMFDKHIFVL